MKKQKIIPCLEVRAISETKNTKVELDIYRRKGIIDLFPWFKEAFQSRDYSYSRGNRIEERGEYDTLSFNMTELAETFFGAYYPMELARFLKPHFVEKELGRIFLERLNSFESENRVSFSFFMNRYIGDSWTYIIPGNISLKELKQEMEQSLPKKYFTGRRQTLDFSSKRKDLNKKIKKNEVSSAFFSRRSNKVRELLLNRIPPIVVIPLSSWLPKLDYFNFIERYNLDTSDLIIERKD